MLVLPLGIAWFMGLVLAVLDGRRPWVGWLALGGLAASFLAMLGLATAVVRDGPIHTVAGGWPAGIGITLRADALGVLFAALSLGVLFAALLYEVLAGVEERGLPALVLFLAVGLSGLCLTGDAFNFYVFFEVSMTAAFVLATYGKRAPEIRAALIFTVVNLLGSAMFLGAIAALYRLTGTLDMVAIGARIDGVEPNSVLLVAAIILAAFSLKLGLFPFHFWVPEVYRDTRPAVAAVLSGALANIGTYGLLRFGADLLPRQLDFGAAALLILGAASVLYGAALAISRRSASEVLAYSAIGQVGYFLIALAIGGPIGYTAAILYAVVNALNKTVLFLAAGLRGGLAGAAFAIGAFSVAGVPPAVGFFGKAALFQAGIAAESVALVAIAFAGGALSFVYMFQIYQRDFWGSAAGEPPSRPAARGLVLALAGGLLALGLWPEPLLALSERAASVLRARVS
jgi:multicomponent Na+:H+ antiporter subunit D